MPPSFRPPRVLTTTTTDAADGERGTQTDRSSTRFTTEVGADNLFFTDVKFRCPPPKRHLRLPKPSSDPPVPTGGGERARGYHGGLTRNSLQSADPLGASQALRVFTVPRRLFQHLSSDHRGDDVPGVLGIDETPPTDGVPDRTQKSRLVPHAATPNGPESAEAHDRLQLLRRGRHRGLYIATSSLVENFTIRIGTRPTWDSRFACS